VAVAGLDLTVGAGECFGLLGPNGAGKTTTIEILEGLTPPDSGDVQILGMPWREGADGRALRERLGIQLQETQLADKLTVSETLGLFRSFYRNSHTVDEVLALVELEEKRRARVVTLSGGQKQRLAVACALVSKPELLFLDEPTTGLDPQSRRQLWEIIRRFRANGGTVMLTTHYMEEAERLCDRVAIMDHGKVIALGTPRELIASLGAAFRSCSRSPWDSLSATRGRASCRWAWGRRQATARSPRCSIRRHGWLRRCSIRQRRACGCAPAASHCSCCRGIRWSIATTRRARRAGWRVWKSTKCCSAPGAGRTSSPCATIARSHRDRAISTS
jgi:ABC-type multidrug transport system ATPase subunit